MKKEISKFASTVKVTVERDGEQITVKNDRGMKWVFEFKDEEEGSVSVASAIGHTTSMMLCSTIASTVFHSSATMLEFELTAKYYE